MTQQDTEARIAALEAALHEVRGKLQVALDDVHRELATAQRPRLGSMKQTRRCPACGGGRILYFRRIKERSRYALVDLALQYQLDGSRFKLIAGVMEAYACRACRLVE